MKTYTIKVTYERIIEVKADSAWDAKTQAKQKIVEQVEAMQDTSSFSAEEYTEPINWRERARSDAGDCFSNYEDDLDAHIKEHMKISDGDAEVEEIYQSFAKEKEDDWRHFYL